MEGWGGGGGRRRWDESVWGADVDEELLIQSAELAEVKTEMDRQSRQMRKLASLIKALQGGKAAEQEAVPKARMATRKAGAAEAGAAGRVACEDGSGERDAGGS